MPALPQHISESRSGMSSSCGIAPRTASGSCHHPLGVHEMTRRVIGDSKRKRAARDRAGRCEQLAHIAHA